MKAFVLEKYSGPMRETEMPVPAPGPDEVLVRVSAAGVNHADERVRSGEFRQIFPVELPMVMGSELSGVVVDRGAGVDDLAPGTPVFGYADQARMGAYAELVTVPRENLARAPGSVTMTEAASLPLAWLTAWQALVEMGDLQPGQTVLIHGGSGGVGTVAVQLTKHLGASVATTVSAHNADLVRELGADTVIDHTREDFTRKLSEVDLVLDTQGGDTLRRSLDVVRPGGLVIGISGPPDPAFADRVGVGPGVRLAIRGLSAKVRRHARRRGVGYRFLFVRPVQEHLRRGAELVDSGVIRPQVGAVLPFARTKEALEVALAGGNRGKVVVRREDDEDRADGAGDRADEAGDPTDDAGEPTDGTGDRATTWNAAATRRIDAAGASLVYRDLGPGGGTPLVLLTHLAATLDEWDPAVVDALAERHRVITVGLPGVGGSTGTVLPTVKGMADAAVDLIRAKGLTRVDLLGFSLGGFVAQQVALDHPGLVRRQVLAGTGPAGGQGIDRPTGAAYIYGDMLRGALARTDAKEFLFFRRDENGKQAARDYLARIAERVMDRDEPITTRALRTQIAAIKEWGRAAPQDLSGIVAPTLIANGDADRMVPSALSEDLHRRIPGSTLEIYPGAGHGGVFQHREAFTSAVLRHLA
ncbi:MAG: alpha/beta fold hydrolase [Actinomycetaceae bacterium]